jgi:molybdopterin molybdotransferase
MHSVAQATEIVFRHAAPLAPQIFELPDVLGQVLAEDVASDLDMPPFDKSLMDGFAVRVSDLIAGSNLTIIEEVMAGQVPRRVVGTRQATRLMTGAPIPEGADTVIPVERTRTVGDAQIQIVEISEHRGGQHIMRRGREMRQGEVVLAVGSEVGPTELGVLATVGRASVRAYPRPDVAVLCTGDELVAAPAVPGPGQIRNGNGPALLGQVRRAGAETRDLGIARDLPDSLKDGILRGLSADVLLLSGGVSAGKLDLVPGVLQELGVQAHFHKVEMKPGKPVYFGTYERRLVFGLPGNPVSASVCFELFVRPALRRLAGHGAATADIVEARLAEDLKYRSDRPTYHPARLQEPTKDGWTVRAVPWQGSADMRSLLRANAFVLLPAAQEHYRAGERFQVLRKS